MAPVWLRIVIGLVLACCTVSVRKSEHVVRDVVVNKLEGPPALPIVSRRGTPPTGEEAPLLGLPEQPPPPAGLASALPILSRRRPPPTGEEAPLLGLPEQPPPPAGLASALPIGSDADAGPSEDNEVEEAAGPAGAVVSERSVKGDPTVAISVLMQVPLGLNSIQLRSLAVMTYVVLYTEWYVLMPPEFIQTVRGPSSLRMCLAEMHPGTVTFTYSVPVDAGWQFRFMRTVQSIESETLSESMRKAIGFSDLLTRFQPADGRVLAQYPKFEASDFTVSEILAWEEHIGIEHRIVESTDRFAELNIQHLLERALVDWFDFLSQERTHPGDTDRHDFGWLHEEQMDESKYSAYHTGLEQEPAPAADYSDYDFLDNMSSPRVGEDDDLPWLEGDTPRRNFIIPADMYDGGFPPLEG